VLAWALFAAAVAYSATLDRDIVTFSGFAPGSIVVKTGERRLYYVIDEQRALRFPVGVGRDGKAWTGTARVDGKYVRPAWSPPDEVRREHPTFRRSLPAAPPTTRWARPRLRYAAANMPSTAPTGRPSIGGFVSYGCIRMYNRDIVELYRLVEIGTPVIVER